VTLVLSNVITTGAYIPLGYTFVSFDLVTNAQHNMGKTNERSH